MSATVQSVATGAEGKNRLYNIVVLLVVKLLFMKPLLSESFAGEEKSYAGMCLFSIVHSGSKSIDESYVSHGFSSLLPSVRGHEI